MKSLRSFTDIVNNHGDHLTCTRAEARQHIEAWQIPTPREKAIKRGIEAYAAICDAYAEGSDAGVEIGDCYYFGPHARAMVDALRAFLNHQSTGRLHCGTLDNLIVKLALASHAMKEDET